MEELFKKRNCHGPGCLVTASIKLEPKLQGTPWVVEMEVHGMWNAPQGKQNGAESTQEIDNAHSGHGAPDALFHEPHRSDAQMRDWRLPCCFSLVNISFLSSGSPHLK